MTPINVQQGFWNDWNASTREIFIGDVSIEQANVIVSWFERLGRKDLSIIEVGCGAGWLCPQLTRFGQVTGTDLSDQALARAAVRAPEVRFVAGDFFKLELGNAEFDVVVSLEVLSHVVDQELFLNRISTLLKRGGHLMIATQNRPALERNDIPEPKPGQLRRWVDRKELQQLLKANFEIEELFSITPRFNRGFLRAINRVINSRKLRRLAKLVACDGLMARVKKWQEDSWLGWTLVALARKRVD